MQDRGRVRRFRDHTIAGVNWRPTRFVDEVPRSCLCGLCLMIPRETVLLPCLHALCQSCCTGNYRSAGTTCPFDQEPFDEAECVRYDLPTRQADMMKLLGCLLREAIKRACKDLQASHDGAVCQQRQEEEEHNERRFQYGDQEKVLAQRLTNPTNFPVLSADLAVAAAPSSPCKEMWADVVRRSASATMTAVTPKVTEADAAHGYPPLPITAGASTRASTETVDAQVKRRPVHAPALAGVWIHHKVTKTGCAAVPLPSAAFAQSPASECGPPDACSVTSKVSPRSEGEVLRKGDNAAYPSASSPCDEGHAEEQEAGSAKFPLSHICTCGGNLSVGSCEDIRPLLHSW
ncbi:hypothetical protein HPB52_004669 [Rhipicephalus sanguineus]|uniref:RING-type domain-containing protein n=1 Tax=Rhipicephalus sanguineus TaxID=34632 RepID=A0A9D4QDF5_RHISA|nr:hypothetical protein HPB52_004669 [Rhipicephalus sanguineus]